MQNQWWLHCLNLMLNTYGCVSTGYKSGYIEFVHNASTIGNLQKMGGSGKAGVADLLFGKAALSAGQRANLLTACYVCSACGAFRA